MSSVEKAYGTLTNATIYYNHTWSIVFQTLMHSETHQFINLDLTVIHPIVVEMFHCINESFDPMVKRLYYKVKEKSGLHQSQ